MKIHEAMKDVAQLAASWPDRYQPGARRVMSEIMERINQKDGAEGGRYLTTVQFAKQVGESAYRIRRMCERGMMPGAFRTSKDGWWLIDIEVNRRAMENQN